MSEIKITKISFEEYVADDKRKFVRNFLSTMMSETVTAVQMYCYGYSDGTNGKTATYVIEYNLCKGLESLVKTRAANGDPTQVTVADVIRVAGHEHRSHI